MLCVHTIHTLTLSHPIKPFFENCLKGYILEDFAISSPIKLKFMQLYFLLALNVSAQIDIINLYLLKRNTSNFDDGTYSLD